MKNTFKRVVCLILAFLMLFAVVPLTYASAEGENVVITAKNGDTYNHYPQVHVKGFGASCVKFYYEDDPEQKSLFWPLDEERLKNNLNNIDEYIVDSIKNGQPNVLRSVIYNYIMDSIGMLALNPDGSNMEGVVSEETGLRYRGNGRWDFYYDCRQSPTTSAEQLYECMDEVFEETGAEKIELVGSSFGANIVTSFVYQYPEFQSKIDTILLRAPSIGGMNFLGELLSGNFDINPAGLCDFISDISDDSVISDFFYLLESAGILESLLDTLAVPVLRVAVYQGVADAAKALLATMPTLWVCIPGDNFYDAMEFLYGENYADPDHEYAELIAEMTHYRFDIADKAAEIYTEAVENTEGLNVAVIAKYGQPAMPFFTGDNVMDDGLVNLSVSSFGATCTTYGSKLPEDYKQQKYTDYNFMSPEWDIDASTCAFPFTTWFIKGVGHAKSPDEYDALSDRILYEDLNVFSDEEYPQFMKLCDDDGEQIEILEVPEEEELTFYEKVMRFFIKYFSIPRSFFETVKNKIPEIFDLTE